MKSEIWHLSRCACVSWANGDVFGNMYYDCTKCTKFCIVLNFVLGSLWFTYGDIKIVLERKIK